MIVAKGETSRDVQGTVCVKQLVLVDHGQTEKGIFGNLACIQNKMKLL